MAIPDGIRRSYSGAAVETTLAANISDSATNIDVTDASTYPEALDGKFAAVLINDGQPNAEVIFYAPKNANTLQNCLRGQDGTQAFAHEAGESVKHVYTALDANEANRHITDATRHDHTQYIRKSVADTIDADHTFTGATQFDGDVTATEFEVTGTANLPIAILGDVVGNAAFHGNVTFDHPVSQTMGTDIADLGIGATALAGSSGVPANSNHRHKIEPKSVLRLCVPAGTVRAWAGTQLPGFNVAGSPHEGEWTWCDGNTIAAANYPEYAGMVGTTYGGTVANPRTPNLNGRVPVGADGGHTQGTQGGSTTKTLSVAEMPAHNHAINDPGHYHSIDGDSGNRIIVTASPSSIRLGGGGTPGATNEVSISDIDDSPTGISIQNNGGGAAFNIEQPWTAVRYIVKVH
jgi:microcystin-dependent protein